MTTPVFTEEQRLRLEALLAPLSAGDAMRLDEVQGFFVALASGPDTMAQEEWQEHVFGENPVFANPGDQAELGELLAAYYQSIAAQLAAGEMPELVLYASEDGEAADYWPWTNAYFYALEVVDTDWFEVADDEGFEDLLYPMMALAGFFDEDENGAALVSFTDAEVENFKDELPEAVLAVFNYWRAKLNSPGTTRRDGDKVGRNDPCPCGSGKKYKQCCGREA